ncbi:MAG: hypothetical protein ACRDIA_07035, partial [Actinomycetota bacterium]
MSGEPRGDAVGPESRKWIAVAPWPALVMASIYTGFLAVNLQRLVAAINVSSDAAWAPVLVNDLANGPRGGLIKVGQAAHFTTLWLLSVTRPLPFRQLFWTASPFLLFLATAALVSWAAARTAGRWAGLLTLSVSLCAGPGILLTSLPQGLRGHTWFAGAVLSALLVWASRGQLPFRLAAPAFLAGGILAGATAASDPLFWAAGLLPFLGAA